MKNTTIAIDLAKSVLEVGINSARGLLREFGIVFAAGAAKVSDQVRLLIEDADAALPLLLRDLFHQFFELMLPVSSRLRNSTWLADPDTLQGNVVARVR